ncbi:NAD-dependent epimerase/dehydratase family protein, partial [Streptomyces avidinii]|uniref:NAD-dependent epimerase/dehydratase family protein n=1 Tax=Streptomyces avidinii TaxID=1895 RepID=UPI00167321A8
MCSGRHRVTVTRWEWGAVVIGGSGSVVLVTGAAGFVGSVVVGRLVERGVRVRVLVHRVGVGVLGVEEVWGESRIVAM